MSFWMSVFTGVLVAFSCRSSYAWGYLQLKKTRALMPTARPFLRSWSSCKHRLGSLATEILLSGRSTLDEKNFSAGSLCQEFTCRDWQPKDRNNSNPDADAKVSDLADVAAVFFHSLSAVLFIPQLALLFAPRGARRPYLANQQKWSQDLWQLQQKGRKTNPLNSCRYRQKLGVYTFLSLPVGQKMYIMEIG